MELHGLNPAPNSIRMIKLRRREAFGVCYGRGEKYIKISVQIPKEENHLEDVGVNDRTISNGVQTSRI